MANLPDESPGGAGVDRFLYGTHRTGRVLFVFIVLLHHRRRIVHFNVTDHPTAAWTAQQVIDAFPHETAPRWLLRDRDAIYGEVFQRRIASMDIDEVVSSPSSPWQKGYASYCTLFG
jgi:putative transposase